MSVNEQVLSYPIPNDAALEPPAEWSESRGKCPVARVKPPSGDQATLLTRYEDVKRVLADPRFTRQLADSSLIRTAVEETLRLDANSGFGLPRYHSRDIFDHGWDLRW